MPFVCFLGALIADVAYVKNQDFQWPIFASWLLAFGALLLGLGIVVNALRYALTMRRRRKAADWLSGLFVFGALITGLSDNLVHSRDGWTSVWPVGLTLSASTVLLLLIALIFKLSSLSKYYVGEAA